MSAVDICGRIETALADILPVYGRTPEFGNDEPEKYAVYTLTDKPAEFGDGEERCMEYLVMLSVFSPVVDTLLYSRIRAAMRAAGFSYMSGGQTGTDGIFPYTTQYHLDFVGVSADG